MNRVNHAKELEKIIKHIAGSRESADAPLPRLLLHCCCAPCSSYCLMYLLPYFEITCFYYNPNITDETEYKKRLAELDRLAGIINETEAERLRGRKIAVTDGAYDAAAFLQKVKEQDLASCPEGGMRCHMCFSLRLSAAYDEARRGGFDYFTTTLTISPHKDAQLINSIGYDIASKGAATCGSASPIWLPSDFKKNDGYKMSIVLSERFGLYRQNYCGCDFSRR